MPANVPHKGLTVLDGRLDPSVWGRFPIRNMLNGIDGEMILHGYGNHAIAAGDPRFVNASTDGTLAVTLGEVILSADGNDNDTAVLASNGVVKLAGNRFVCQLTLKMDDVADSAFLVGFAQSATDPILDAGLDVEASAFGLFKKDTGNDLYFIEKLATGSSTLTDTGVDIAADTDVVLKMQSTSAGNVEIYIGGTKVLTRPYPGVASGRLVAAVKVGADDAASLNLGSAIAFGVAE